MQMGIKILELKLEADKQAKWQNTILLWEEEFENLSNDPEFTHVSWSVNGVVQKVLNARRVLTAPNVRRFSRKHQRYFYVIAKQDVSNDIF